MDALGCRSSVPDAWWPQMMSLTALDNGDFSRATIGPPSGWPQELRAVAAQMLRSRSPQWLVIGPQLCLLYNDACVEVLGDRHPVAPGSPLREVWPEAWAELEPVLARAFAGESLLLEHRLLRRLRNGDPVESCFTFSVAPVVADGQITGLQCLLQETTSAAVAGRECGCSSTACMSTHGVDLRARHLAEQSAEDERRRLRALLEALPVGVAYASREGTLQTVNAALRDVWGDYPMSSDVDEYAEWKGWWPPGHPRAGERLAATDWPMARALGGESVKGELVEILTFGEPAKRRIIQLHSAPVHDDRGSTLGAVTVQQDVSDRVRAETALRDSEARFRALADNIPQLAWMADADGSLFWYNDRWFDFTGTTFEEMQEPGWQAVIHPDHLDRITAKAVHHVTSGEPFDDTFPLRSRDGDYRWFLSRAVPIRNECGQIVRWFGTHTDVTPQRDAEDALREADRRKDEFLAMLAHELRNPLAPISTAAALLLEPSVLPEHICGAAGIIARQVRHMEQLVDDLLDVSRVTRGLILLQNETFDVREAAKGAVEQARPLLDALRHTLVMDEGSRPVRIRGDRARVTQVIANLLNNAAKFTRPGGRIEVEVSIAESSAVIVVSDNGQGIPSAFMPRLFELFSQGEPGLDRARGGLGIGLALVHSLVALHGGTVSAASEGIDRGSSFTVRLPLAEAPDVPAALPDGIAQKRHALSIVVVDDNVDAAFGLQILLEAYGHHVQVAHDATTALELDPDLAVDVYLLDIGLPDMSGNELARRLRADPRRCGSRLFALTGYGRDVDRAATKEAGFDEHFVKPLDPRLLKRLLEDLATGS
jgi:PAS domain S-box-containing protein